MEDRSRVEKRAYERVSKAMDLELMLLLFIIILCIVLGLFFK